MFKEASAEHIRRLDRLIDRGGAARLKKMYEQSLAELERKLAKALRGGAAKFTVQQHRTMIAQVRQGIMATAKDLGGGLSKATIETQKEALTGLIKDVRKLEKSLSGTTVVLPIEEASRFAGVIDKRRTSLMKLNKTSMARYGAGTVKAMEKQMSLSLSQGESGHAAIDRMMKTADIEWWRAERIVRTEQAWAYNATQMDGLTASAEDLPDMMLRWTELVDDGTLSPLDNRVGKDSIALHGQLVKPGDFFFMPAGPWPSLNGKSWQHPPNRPNDRAVLQPWRPAWGAYGYYLKGGTKVVAVPPPKKKR